MAELYRSNLFLFIGRLITILFNGTLKAIAAAEPEQ